MLKFARDQRFFLCATSALELPLSGQRLAFRGICLGIDETNREVLERIGCSPTIVVGLQAGLEVLCGAYVEAFISAAKDVNMMDHSTQGRLNFSYCGLP